MTLLEITSAKAILLALIVIVPIILLLVIYFFYQKKVKEIEYSQDKLSDKDLLLMFQKEPDGYLTSARLAKKSGLSKSDARFRLQYFQHNGVLSYSSSNTLKMYYQLNEPLEEREIPPLSNKPFLTVEDLLLLFKTFDYRITLQKICVATGLPISIIKRELKYFEKEKILETVSYSNDMTGYSKTTYLLKEPYRSKPDEFLELESKMNIELEKIYKTEFEDKDFV